MRALASAALLTLTAASQAQHFRVISTPFGFGVGLTADGQCIFGTAGYSPAWRWTPHAGIEFFPTSFEYEFGMVHAASGRGELLVGMAAWRSYNAPFPAIWTLEKLRVAPTAESIARAVSADGMVAAGHTQMEPFRWITSQASIQPLGLLPGWFRAQATAITADGTMLVGFATSGTQRVLFRWSESGYEILANIAAGAAEARAVSADGQVVACVIDDRMYRWTAATGLVDLGLPPGMTSAAPVSMDASGEVLVGNAQTPSIIKPIVWTAATGVVTLQDYLTARGLNLSGVTLGWALGVSADGLTFASYATAPGQAGSIGIAVLPGGACLANCDASTVAPVLTIADFACFLQRFSEGDPYANCDRSTTPPVLNVADFSCFLRRFAAGCP